MPQAFAPRPLAALAVFFGGTIALSVCLQTVLSDTNAGQPASGAWVHLASSIMSRAMWTDVATALGADRIAIAKGEFAAPFLPIWLAVAGFSVAVLIVGAGVAALLGRRSFADSLKSWACRGWMWWLALGGWEALNIAGGISGWNGLSAILRDTLPIWLAIALGGWLAAIIPTSIKPHEPTAGLATKSPRWGLAIVGVLCLTYLAVFLWMNWQLYFGLHVPHGDSAMYEEHLWNLTHGKGFRSYLDDGRLFLGEHVQVVHLLLIPVHAIWPSHLTLETCESLALASGAWPVFWIARRHGSSTTAGILLASAYLLYTPLHFLDIAVDLKTFRPTSFGVPAVLFALDQMERRHYRSMAILFLIALSAKEDYAVIVSCVGLWLSFFGNVPDESADEHKRRRIWGIWLTIFGAAYLLVVIKFVIPVFRGDVPHYARYFGELGNTPGDVAASFFTQPGVVLGKLFSRRSLLYALLLLAPIAFLPLRSASRLLVALPWFGVLCLLEFTADPAQQGTQMLVPGHHFHAPIVPVLFWCAAAGLGAPSILARMRLQSNDTSSTAPLHSAGLAFGCALFAGAILGFSPLSVGFWDSGSQLHWESRFVPDERATKVAVIEELIPADARVFSTDFVHTRLTHRKRSYDYSAFKRASDEELTNPLDGEVYYIVIDLKSRYNLDKPPGERIESPADIPAYAADSDAWEVVEHDATEHFLVLRRRNNR